MTSPKDFQNQLEKILGMSIRDGKLNLHFSWNNATEAKIQLVNVRQIQQELKLLKKDIGNTISQIRSGYATKHAHIGTGISTGFMAGLIGKRKQSKINTIQRDALRQDKLDAVKPYESLNRTIDQIIFELEKTKIQLDAATKDKT